MTQSRGENVGPPLVETVLGVQFTELKAFTLAHYGLFWSSVEKAYPTIQHKERLLSTIELRERSFPKRMLLLQDGLELPRALLSNSSGEKLVQLQPDRYLENWRKTPDGTYPGFEQNLAWFLEGLSKFQAFLRQYSLGELAIEQCELTYVNHIPVADSADFFAGAVETFSVLREPDRSRMPGVRDRFSYNLSSWLDELEGRLHASINPILSREHVQLDFRLTARGDARDAGVDSVGDWFSKAHSLTYDSFKYLTNQEMHAKWEV